MAGYYDDFMGAVALPDDLNEPAVTYSSTKSHAGNAIPGYAPLNPRHTYAWVEREDGATGRFNNSTLTGGAQYKTNAGIHEWLSYDQNRRNAGSYDGKAQLQSPDSITNANRQKYKAGADYATVVEGYLMFCNGYDTTNRYYAATGTNDATFGRDKAKQEYPLLQAHLLSIYEHTLQEFIRARYCTMMLSLYQTPTKCSIPFILLPAETFWSTKFTLHQPPMTPYSHTMGL